MTTLETKELTAAELRQIATRINSMLRKIDHPAHNRRMLRFISNSSEDQITADTTMRFLESGAAALIEEICGVPATVTVKFSPMENV